MACVHLICGMICSGKTFFAGTLREKYNAVILSTDEITLALPQEAIRDCFDEVSAAVNGYLLEKAAQIIDAGTDVILDWGFWSKADRDRARCFFTQRGIGVIFYYLDTTESTLEANTAGRNDAVLRGETTAFYVDEGLARKCCSLFEVPSKDEIDVWVINDRV